MDIDLENNAVVGILLSREDKDLLGATCFCQVEAFRGVNSVKKMHS